jgi:hypothetical protein
MKTVRAISIRQPHVEQILRGKKKYEFRSRQTRIRGQVYLYASKTPADDCYWGEIGLNPGDLPVGKIIGTVEIVDCVWFKAEYCYGYELRNPRRLQRQLVPRNQPQPVFWRPQF